MTTPPIRLVPLAVIRWGLTALVIVALGLATLGIYQNLQRVHSLCNYAKQNRLAAIEDIRAGWQLTIDRSVAMAVEEGRTAEAIHLRDVTGPAFVKFQVDAANKRHPPIDCSQL